jgi:hypothetical protein
MLRAASTDLVVTRLDEVDTAALTNAVLRTGRKIERPT